MKKSPTSHSSQTDWVRLDALDDGDIDLSDIPEITALMFAKGVVRRGLKPLGRTRITLHLDSDVLKWFKGQGRGYESHINALLRAYVRAHNKPAVSPRKNGKHSAQTRACMQNQRTNRSKQK